MADEFRKGMILGRSGEKIGKRMAQGDGHDLFGRKESGADGAEPGAEMPPDGSGAEDGKRLKKPLSNKAELHVGMIGGEFAADLPAIVVGLAMQILIAGAPGPERHGGHPEVIAVGAKGMNRLLEGHLDFEAYAIEPDNRKRIEREVGAKQDFAASLGMNHQHEADETAHGTPEQIDAAIPHRDVAFAIHRAGRLDEG